MTWTPGLVLDYAQTLQYVLEGYDNRWFVRLWHMWPAVQNPASRAGCRGASYPIANTCDRVDCGYSDDLWIDVWVERPTTGTELDPAWV